jgi:V/A-type H+-transporting ATPase subunit E
MAEEFQALIERIQREAVDTGEQQAAKIVTQAREKAAALVKEAEVRAAALVEKAEEEARQFTSRGEQALAQSARDLLISVGQGVEKLFSELVADEVASATDAASLQPVLTRVIASYVEAGGENQRLHVLLKEEDKVALEQHFKGVFAEALKKGLAIKTDPRMKGGFKIRLADQHLEHDFSREAIAEAVSAFLRPALAETVYRVAREQA